MRGAYKVSFALVLLLTSLAFVATGASVVFQARLTAGQTANWNVFIVVGSYLAFVRANSSLGSHPWNLTGRLSGSSLTHSLFQSKDKHC
jgi:hypothetical protein